MGLHESRPYMIIPAMSVQDFVNVPYAERAKRVATVPVGVIGRIIDPVRAGRLSKRGKQILVVLARGLLSDPEWPRKALEGRFDDIRPCIGCNQGCIDNIHKMKPLTCLHNPMVGRETEFQIIKSEKPKRVAVIGGGPSRT